MNVCLIGCGGISRVHLSAVDKQKENGFVLTAVCDVVLSKAENVAKVRGCRAYSDYREMILSEKPDIVHICTPHYLHSEMAVFCLERNVNVVLEKPCATDIENLSALYRAQRLSHAKSAVCFQNRYNPSVVFAKKLIDSGKYGQIKTARAFLTWKRDADYYSADSWRGTLKEECGGVLINQAIHTHDLLKYLTGKNTVSIDASVSNFHLKDEIEVEDTACVFFNFEDDVRAVYYATTAYGTSEKPLIDLVFSSGTLRVEDKNVYFIGEKGIEILFSETGEENVPGKKEWGDSHSKLISDFYSCVTNDRTFSIDVFEGGKAVEDLICIYRSSVEKRRIFISELGDVLCK